MFGIRAVMLILFGAVVLASVAGIAVGVFLLAQQFEPGLIPIVLGAVALTTGGSATAMMLRTQRA